MRSGAKMVFFNIAVWLKNGQRVVEGTELESDQQELHSDFIASQRKGTHKIQTPMFDCHDSTFCPSTNTDVLLS